MKRKRFISAVLHVKCGLDWGAVSYWALAYLLCAPKVKIFPYQVQTGMWLPAITDGNTPLKTSTGPPEIISLDNPFTQNRCQWNGLGLRGSPLIQWSGVTITSGTCLVANVFSRQSSFLQSILSQTVFIHFKICIGHAEIGNFSCPEQL